jgi:hypothetical protein
VIRYYPKNRVLTDQVTTGEEFESRNQSYSGPYYVDHRGRAFAGATPWALPISVPLTRVGLNQESRPPVDLTNQIPHYPAPTATDYARGFFYRYFLKKGNRIQDIIECSRETYREYESTRGAQTSTAYQAFDIFWKLTGPEKDIRTGKYVTAGILDTNRRIVERTDKVYPGFKNYIGEEYLKYSLPTSK